jgi:hypothetical protein
MYDHERASHFKSDRDTAGIVDIVDGAAPKMLLATCREDTPGFQLSSGTISTRFGSREPVISDVQSGAGGIRRLTQLTQTIYASLVSRTRLKILSKSFYRRPLASLSSSGDVPLIILTNRIFSATQWQGKNRPQDRFWQNISDLFQRSRPPSKPRVRAMW